MIEMILFTAFLLIVLLVIRVSEEMWGEEPPKRVPHPEDVADLLKLTGSEGDDLPRPVDIRKEVADGLREHLTESRSLNEEEKSG